MAMPDTDPCRGADNPMRRDGGGQFRRAFCAGLVLAACLGGCRAVDHAQVDVLERELREQEKYIYELEDYLVEYSEKLRQCRLSCRAPAPAAETRSTRVRASEPTLANDNLPSPIAPPRDEVQAEGPESPPTLEIPAENTPPAAPPESPPANPDEIELPDLEIGPTSQTPWSDGTHTSAEQVTIPGESTNAGPLLIPDPAAFALGADPLSESEFEAGASMPQSGLAADEGLRPLDANPGPPPTLAESQRLTPSRLEIRQLYASPAANNPAKVAALLVVVEALNATNEPVDAAGEISLMVMGSNAQDVGARIDRWDFSADETKAAWQSSQLGDGLHLELPLGDRTLPHGKLELWARMVDGDGQKLLARLPFDASKLTTLDAATAATAVPSADGQIVRPVVAAASAEDVPTAEDAEATWRRAADDLVAPASRAAPATAPPTGWMRQSAAGHASASATMRSGKRAANGRSWQQSSLESTARENAESQSRRDPSLQNAGAVAD